MVYLSISRKVKYYTKTDMNTMLARKADSEHNHDKVYYTKAFVDGLLALKADLTHYYKNRYYLRV